MDVKRSFVIEIEPVPKGRPRCRCIPIGPKKARAHIYTPKKTEKYEDAIAQIIREAWAETGILVGPVEVNCEVFAPRPKTRPKPKHGGGPTLEEWKTGSALPKTSKPDKDNYEKAILDGLDKAGLWFDDAQVWSGRTRKWYAALGDNPSVSFTISGRTLD